MILSVYQPDNVMSLQSALLIYSSGPTHARKVFVTKHPVAEDKITGRPIIRAGVPLKDADYVRLVKGLREQDQSLIEWNDQRILAKGDGRVIWWSAPKKRAMFFKQSDLAGKTFDGKGTLACPGLVFMASHNDLRVFALRGSNRPTKDTPLCQAPFFNVWASGQVCIGNSIRPGKSDALQIDKWEETFFGSNFTHPNFTEKNRLTRGIHPCEFWKTQIETPSATFPEEVLVGLDLTVGDLLDPNVHNKLNKLKAIGEF